MLLNEKNELHNRNLHISGLLEEKVDIQNEKVDIESILREKGNVFTKKTTDHIRKLFEKFSADIIKPVSGYGKGKYKFNKKLLVF